MTENEAIRELEGYAKYSWGSLNESFKVAIQALEEIQQYRAIGTVEQLKTMFDGFWKLKDLCEEYEKYGLPEDYWKLNEMCKEYSAIGTIEEFKALKEADMRGANRAVDEFANYLHKIAKENNGLRLSSETKSWTHPCIFDYLEEFKDEQICKEGT